MAACLFGLISCTDFTQEVEPDVLEVVSGDSIAFDFQGGPGSVTLKSGSKWDVVKPDWITVVSISPSTVPFQWKINLECEANDGVKSRSGDIIFKSGGKSINLSVSQYSKPVVEVTSLDLVSEVTLNLGESMTLDVTVYPENATDKTVSWASSNPSVVSVIEGKITALKAGGPVTITATAGSKSAKCVVTVYVPVTSITISPEEVSVEEGNTVTLTATVSPKEATDQSYTWASDNTAAATVTQKGVVKGVKPGEANITVLTSDGKRWGKCRVTVTNKTILVTNISIDPDDFYLAKGDSKQLTVNYSPSKATNKSVTWVSSNKSVATVDANGLVYGKGLGTATLTATTVDGGNRTATCTVRVVTPPSSITFDSNSYGVYVGDQLDLRGHYSVSPSGSYEGLALEIDDRNVASESWDMVIKGVSPGETTVRVRSAVKDGVTASFRIKVGNKVTGISVNPSSPTLTIGENRRVSVTFTPDNVLSKSMKWETNNSSVATIKSYDEDSAVIWGVKPGSAVLTVISDDNPSVRASVNVTVIDAYTQPETVDLGLSVKWGSFNIGSGSPEEPGRYFAWGETQTDWNYDWAHYLYCNGTGTSINKYNWYSGFGSVDNKTVLDREDDVAHMAFGGNWRMPTRDEWRELNQSCKWEWTQVNGVDGYKVTGKTIGYTDRSIFLPVTGVYRGESRGEKSTGYYWSSALTLYGTTVSRAYYEKFSQSLQGDWEIEERCLGMAVRPVFGTQAVPVTGISLDKELIRTSAGTQDVIKATVFPNDASDKSVHWESDDTSVATVDQNGLVKAVGSGLARITATTNNGGFTATCRVAVFQGYDYIDVPYAVDLGLSVKWAPCNIGARYEYEDGMYFAWGELNTQKDFSWNNYTLCNGSENSLTKYNSISTYGKVDNIKKLEYDDDPGYMLYGTDWHLPTRGQWEELVGLCTWTWTKRNNHYGYEVKGPNGNTIFLPASGYYRNKSCAGYGSSGYYWASEIESNYPSSAYLCSFDSNGQKPDSYSSRCYGLSVRAVTGEPDYDYEWFLGQWKVGTTANVNETWTISPYIYGQSYYISGIDGFEDKVPVDYNPNNATFRLTAHQNFKTTKIPYYGVYYDAVMSLVGCVSYNNTVGFVWGSYDDGGIYDYDILTGYISGSKIYLEPGSLTNIDGNSGNYPIVQFGFVIQYEDNYQQKQYYFNDYHPFLPQSITRTSYKYLKPARTQAANSSGSQPKGRWRTLKERLKVTKRQKF